MSSVAHTVTQRSLYIEVTFLHTPDGYWGFTHQLPVYAYGESFQDCVETLCRNVTRLVTTGERAVNRAVSATADATMTVDNLSTTPVCTMKLFNPRWPRRQRPSTVVATESRGRGRVLPAAVKPRY